MDAPTGRISLECPRMKTPARLMREIREAHSLLIWTLVRTDAPGKRSRTLAAKKLMQASRELYGALTKEKK